LKEKNRQLLAPIEMEILSLRAKLSLKITDFFLPRNDGETDCFASLTMIDWNEKRDQCSKEKNPVLLLKKKFPPK
jgi:hypothetical protein